MTGGAAAAPVERRSKREAVEKGRKREKIEITESVPCDRLPLRGYY